MESDTSQIYYVLEEHKERKKKIKPYYKYSYDIDLYNFVFSRLKSSNIRNIILNDRK